MRAKLEILLACAFLPPALELVSARRVLRLLERIPPRGVAGGAPAALARRVDAVLSRLPLVWSHTCLRRAVVLAAMLRREGLAPEVIIGVRHSAAGALEAHAWLRCDGVEPFLDTTDTTGYARLTGARNVTP